MGESSWPDYMEDIHRGDLLKPVVTTTAVYEGYEDSAIQLMIAADPFTGTLAYDPSGRITTIDAAVTEFDAFTDSLAAETDWTSAMSIAETTVDGLIDDTYVNADINAYATLLDNDMNVNVFPQFKSGMRNVNAIMSSAFVLGEADIYNKRTDNVTKYGTDARRALHLQRNDMIMKGAAKMTDDLMAKAQLEAEVANTLVEAGRIAIVAGKEQVDMQIDINELGGRWINEAYVYGGNMLAAVSGATGATTAGQVSKTRSALSGAVSGAAMGAAVTGGNPIGAAVGGLIGLGAAILGF